MTRARLDSRGEAGGFVRWDEIYLYPPVLGTQWARKVGSGRLTSIFPNNIQICFVGQVRLQLVPKRAAAFLRAV